MNGLCRNKTESPPSFASSFPAATLVFSFLFPLFLRFASLHLFFPFFFPRTEWSDWPTTAYTNITWLLRHEYLGFPNCLIRLTIHRNLILYRSRLVRFFSVSSRLFYLFSNCLIELIIHHCTTRYTEWPILSNSDDAKNIFCLTWYRETNNL